MTTVVEAELEQIVRTVWSSLSDAPLEGERAAPPDPGPAVTSVVHIDGAWHGAVVVRCSTAVARALTAEVFDAGVDPGPEDVVDALGELNNMVAGNVKALLPEGCGLSLPTVAFGTSYDLSVVGAAPLASASFAAPDGDVVVTVVQQVVDGLTP